MLEKQTAINYMRMAVRLGYGRWIKYSSIFQGLFWPFLVCQGTVSSSSFMFVCRKLRPQGFSQSLWALSCPASVSFRSDQVPRTGSCYPFSADHKGSLEWCELPLHFTVGKLMNVHVCSHICYWSYLGCISQDEKWETNTLSKQWSLPLNRKETTYQ